MGAFGIDSEFILPIGKPPLIRIICPVTWGLLVPEIIPYDLIAQRNLAERARLLT